MRTQHIIPAIIPDSLEHLTLRLREIRDVVMRVQIDVMDGTYAPTTSWPYSGIDRDRFEAIRREDEGLPYWQDVEFEIDLMVQKPEDRIEEWALAGAACLIIHVDSTDALERICADCTERRIEVALAVSPSTDIEALAPYIESAVFVQCMGSDRIGRHGVALDPRTYEVVRTIRKRWPTIPVGVDIGVNEETIPKLIQAGATRFAAGSAVFGGGDAKHAFATLEAMTRELLHDIPESDE
jgi:ribulose-phosphate 3-epimerase